MNMIELSYLDFCRTAYSDILGEVRTAGSLGATLFRAHISPGDWSDAATGDLALNMIVSPEVKARVADVGAGPLRGPYVRDGFVVIPPGTPTSFVIANDHDILACAIPYRRLARMDPDGLLPADGDFGRLHAVCNMDPQVSLLMMRLWHQMNSPHADSGLLSDALVLQLVARLVRLSGAARRRAVGGLAPWQVRRAQDRIRDSLSTGVSLADLAAEVGLSPWHFCRSFRETTGIAPHRAQILARMERARDLLARGDRTIAEIALDCGYRSNQAFARVFRKEVGTTPAAFRRAARA